MNREEFPTVVGYLLREVLTQTNKFDGDNRLLRPHPFSVTKFLKLHNNWFARSATIVQSMAPYTNGTVVASASD